MLLKLFGYEPLNKLGFFLLSFFFKNIAGNNEKSKRMNTVLCSPVVSRETGCDIFYSSLLLTTAHRDCMGKICEVSVRKGQRLLSRAAYLGPRQKTTTAATPARGRRRRQADQPGRADNAQRPCFSQRSTGLAPRRAASRSVGW